MISRHLFFVFCFLFLVKSNSFFLLKKSVVPFLGVRLGTGLYTSCILKERTKEQDEWMIPKYPGFNGQSMLPIKGTLPLISSQSAIVSIIETTYQGIDRSLMEEGVVWRGWVMRVWVTFYKDTHHYIDHIDRSQHSTNTGWSSNKNKCKIYQQ